VPEGVAVISPRLPKDVFGQLVQSNYELRAIGRNVNQIAKSLNLYPGKITDAERKALAAVPARLAEHTEGLAKALRDVSPVRSVRREPVR